MATRNRAAITRHGRSRKGFTLLEMMVAIAVMAVTAIAIFQSNSTALRQQEALEHITIGHWVLMDQIAKHHLESIVDQQLTSGQRQTLVMQAGQEFEIHKENVSIENSYVDQLEFSVYRVVNGRVEEAPIQRAVTFEGNRESTE